MNIQRHVLSGLFLSLLPLSSPGATEPSDVITGYYTATYDFANAGNILVVGGARDETAGGIETWSMLNFQRRKRADLRCAVHQLRVVPPGSHAVFAGARSNSGRPGLGAVNGLLGVLNLSTMQVNRELEIDFLFHAIAVTPNGKYLITVGSDVESGDHPLETEHHNVQSGTHPTSITRPGIEVRKLPDLAIVSHIQFPGFENVNSLACGPENKICFLAGGSTADNEIAANGFLAQWDLERRSLVSIRKTTVPIWRLAVTHSGQQLASAGGNLTEGAGELLVWDVHASKKPVILTTSLDTFDIAYSPDDRFLISSGVRLEQLVAGRVPEPAGGVIKIWDLASGREVWRAKTKNLCVKVAFSPDAKYAVASEIGGRIHIWTLRDIVTDAGNSTRP